LAAGDIALRFQPQSFSVAGALGQKSRGPVARAQVKAELFNFDRLFRNADKSADAYLDPGSAGLSGENC
jgi:hypothetical protein